MTSKEAFEKIIDLCNHYQHKIVKDTKVATIWGYPVDNIRKDLEVLEIIKKSITHKENHKYVLNGKLKGQKFMTMNLYIIGDTDFNKVKEWLENE